MVCILVANGDYMATIWTKGSSCNASVVLAKVGKLSASVQVKDTKRRLATLLLTRTPVLVVRFPVVCGEWGIEIVPRQWQCGLHWGRW